jgi:hypothetical protein
MSRGDPVERNVTLLAGALALAATAIALVQSWGRWLDPLIDTGRDLYIPEQVRAGALVYSDLLYFYPPLTPYLLAGVTALTGSSLVAYTAIGLATALFTALALGAMTRLLAGTYAAGIVVLLFVSFSLAGVSGWGSNYIFPYAHAATFGMLFFLAGATLLALRIWGGGGNVHLAFALLFLLAASWTKIEYFVFATVLVVFVAVVHRIGWSWIAGYAGALALSLAGAAAWFGPGELRANVLPPALLSGDSARFFYSNVSGLAEWQENLFRSAMGAALIGTFILLLRFWSQRPALRLVIVVALLIVTLALANDLFFRAWTLLQIALVPFAIRRPREPLAFLLLLSLCASSRIVLEILPAWYGFVLILPTLVLIAYVLVAWLPEKEIYSRRAALSWLPLFALLSASALLSANRLYDEARAVATPRGTYYDVSAERGASVSGLIRHLQDRGARELVVFPEGLGINYLARVRTPLRHHTFTPVEIVGREPEILAELERKRPEFVAIVPRDVREFGYRGFGDDYGREIVDWIRTEYALEAQFGNTILFRVRPQSSR